MRIKMTHPNGGQIEVSGFRAKSVADQWWAAQATPEPEPDEPEAPKVVGAGTTFLGGDDRSYEYGARSRWQDMPVVFGFQPNPRPDMRGGN